YQSFQGLGEKVHVSVDVPGVDGAVSGYATPSLPAPVGTTYHRPFGNSFWASPFTMIVFSAFAIGLLGFCIFILLHPKRQREQLPDNLAVLASAIRAGHSFVGALSVVVNDAPEPARSEFQRVVADEQLGRPLDEALETVVYRMRNQDLAQVALVAALQRETGG